jgi:hypothetical protein
VGEALFKGVMAGRAKLSEIFFEKSDELSGDRNLLGGACELLKDVLQPSAVVGEEERVGHREGFACGLRGDEGIAVTVAAYP